MTIINFKDINISQNKKFLFIGIFSLILGLIASILFTNASFGINVFLLTLIFVLSNFFLRSIFQSRVFVSRYDIISLMMVLMSASIVFYYERGLQFFTILFIMSLSLPSVLLPVKSKYFDRFSFIHSYIVAQLESFFEITKYHNYLDKIEIKAPSARRMNYIKYVVMGIVISVPFMCIITLLLSSADQVFGEMISNFFNKIFEFDLQFSSYLIQGIFIFGTTAVITLIYLAYSYLSKSKETNDKAIIPARSHWIVNTIVLNNINIIFLVFIIIQFVYLFGGEENIIARGMSYSQYARKGFFELQFITVIMMSVLYGIYKFGSENGLASKIILRFSAGINILMTLIIIFSAHRRMDLYEQTYGYTLLRFYPHMVIFIEAILFLFLFFINIKRSYFKHFSLFMLIVIAGFVSVIGFLNPVNIVIKNNMKMERADFYYLQRFGSENFLYSVDNYNDIYNCNNKYLVFEETKNSDLRSFNLVKYFGEEKKEDIQNSEFWEKCYY